MGEAFPVLKGFRQSIDLAARNFFIRHRLNTLQRAVAIAALARRRLAAGMISLRWRLRTDKKAGRPAEALRRRGIGYGEFRFDTPRLAVESFIEKPLFSQQPASI
jgi:hypothetical protein